MDTQKKVKSRKEWKRTGTTSNDPIATLISMHELLGKKWSLPVLYFILENEPCQFCDLKRSLSGISNKMLSKTLEELNQEHGFINRNIISEKPLRVEYSMTDRGRSLAPVIDALQEWGRDYLE